nr:restriction endonuclease subunit S [Achromobacter ruhlandii]
MLDSVAKRGSGHTPSKDEADYWNGGIKWVSLADSWRLDKGYIVDTDKTISDQGIQHSSAVLHPAGTVVMTRDAGVGKSGILAKPMAVSQHFIVWDCSESVDLHNRYLYHWLQHEKPEFERVAVGSTIKTIGLPYFKRLKIKLPPLAEQQAIAMVIDAWDAAISIAEKTYVNCSRQKASLMQSLLTGRVRLRSQNPALPRSHASEMFVPISTRRNGSEELLSVTQDMGVLPRRLLDRRVVMPEGSTDTYKLVEPGDFIISLRSFEGGLEYSPYRGLVSPAYTVLRAKVPICDSFYRHYFKSEDFIGRLAVAVIGIRDGKQISYDDFAFLKLPVPDIEEQRSIASVLDDAEREMKLIAAQIESLKVEKRTLMAELLNGTRRVKVPSAVSVSPVKEAT